MDGATFAGYLYHSYAHPKETIEWAIKEIPTIAKRWESRQGGNNYGMVEFRNENAMTKLAAEVARIGITPNAAVDMWTVSAVARSAFEMKYKEYLKQGFSKTKATEKAKTDAAATVNTAQQSAESMFLSPRQKDKDTWSVATTLFRNANLGYQRRINQSIKDLQHILKDKQGMLDYRAKQLENEGLTHDQAAKAAEEDLRHLKAKSVGRIALYGMGLEFAWQLGTMGFTALARELFLPTDEERKDTALERFLRHTNAAGLGWKDLAILSPLGLIVGYPFANAIASGITSLYANGGKAQRGRLKKWIVSMPAGQDALNLIESVNNELAKTKSPADWWGVAHQALSLLTSAGLGADATVVENTMAAMYDLIKTNKNLTANQVLLDLDFILNAPNSLTKRLAASLKSSDHTEFIKQYTTLRSKYGALYLLRDPKDMKKLQTKKEKEYANQQKEMAKPKK
jgi:hypothetical protein